MEVEDFKYKIDVLAENLTDEEKKYIHFYTFRNFVYHLPQIKRNKREAISLLTAYFEEIESGSFTFCKMEGYNLALKYLHNLSIIYKKQLGFMNRMSTSAALIYGLLGDLVFLITGLSEAIKYVPITILLMLFYVWFVDTYKARQFKIYGFFY